MAIYFVILFATFGLRNISYRNKRFIFLLFFIFLSFIGFFRDFDVGLDNVVYEMNFSAATMDPNTWSAYTEFEPGFAFFLALFKTFVSDDYFMFNGFIFLVYMCGVCFLINKESKNVILSLFFFIILLYYTASFNIMRQCTALGLFCFTFPLLRNKKFVLYETFVLLLTFLVHRSMIVFSILPLCYNSKVQSIITNKKTVYILLACSYVCVFMTSYLYRFIPMLSQYVSFLGDRYVLYAKMSSQAEETISIYSSLLKTVFAIYVVHISSIRTRGSLSYFAYILGIIFSNVFGAFSSLFIRLPFNLLFLQIILFSNLWYEIPNTRKRQMFKLSVCLINFVLFTNAMIKNFDFVVPYINRLFSL